MSVLTGEMYFNVKVVIERENDRGKIKKFPELYLIKAVNVTDAEAKMVQLFVDEGETADYRITNVTETKIRKVVE